MKISDYAKLEASLSAITDLSAKIIDILEDAIQEDFPSMPNAQKEITSIEGNYPHWVCQACGEKYSTKGQFEYSTWHLDECEVCHKLKAVTESRDFYYPNFNGPIDSKKESTEILVEKVCYNCMCTLSQEYAEAYGIGRCDLCDKKDFLFNLVDDK